MKQPTPESMTSGPQAAAMNARMSEIGKELARCPFGSHPRARELEEELERLRPLYRKTLEAGQ